MNLQRKEVMSPSYIEVSHGRLYLWPNIGATVGLHLRSEAAGVRAPDWIKNLLYSGSPDHPTFQATIPPSVLQVVRGFRSCQLPLLAIASEDPERFVLLANQSPALAFALAYRAWTTDEHISLSYGSHRELWSALDYPRSRSFARCMAKIAPTLLDPYVAPMLASRWTYNPAFRRILRHVRHINHAVLRCLLTIDDDALAPWCIRVAESDRGTDGRTAALIRMLRAHWRLVHPQLQMDYSAIQDRAGLERALYRLQCELASDKFFLRELYTGSFPNPPIPGAEAIAPISSSDMLHQEGQLQQNCSASYVRAVYAGKAYLYTCRPRRLTILVERNDQGQWYLSAVEGPGNTRASEEDFAFVRNWFTSRIQMTS